MVEAESVDKWISTAGGVVLSSKKTQSIPLPTPILTLTRLQDPAAESSAVGP